MSFPFKPRQRARLQETPSGFGFTRRRFLRLSVGGAAGLALTPFAPLNAQAGTASWKRWSDPSTWGGSVPGPNDLAQVSGNVLLDADAHVGRVMVEPGAILAFGPDRSVTLQSEGNIVVGGELWMRPSRSSVVHRIVFPNVSEERFQGGGMEVLESDVGLWATGSGVLRIEGSPKRAWTRTAAGVAAGATSIRLRDDPTGWHVGDQLVLTPTEAPDSPAPWSYDYPKIRMISGRLITLSQPVRHRHPEVRVKPGVAFTPEVLNLTRNVRIEGTPKGRAHVWINSTEPQKIAYAQLMHMGPRQADPSHPFTVPVLGRYPLHFHMSDNGTRGSMVKGTVVSKSGNRAFVPHGSHGITFQECISHDTSSGAYWWDPPTDTEMSRSEAIVWKDCVASEVTVPEVAEEQDPSGYHMGAFNLGSGTGNLLSGCVAVGVTKGLDSSGIDWATIDWLSEDNVSHNNEWHGNFSWVNPVDVSYTKRLVAYHNGHAGISHGAYLNPHHYEDLILYGNGEEAIQLVAGSFGDIRVRFVNAYCDGAGLSEYLVATSEHYAHPRGPTRFEGCTFTGYRKAAVRVNDDIEQKGIPDRIDFIDCRYGGNEFSLGSKVAPDTRLRVRDPRHGELTIRREDQPGAPRPRWNASVTRGWAT